MGKGKKQGKGKSKKFVPLDVNNLPLPSRSEKSRNSTNTSTDVSISSGDIKSSEKGKISKEKSVKTSTSDVLEKSDLSTDCNSFEADESTDSTNNLIGQRDESVSNETSTIDNVLVESHSNFSKGEISYGDDEPEKVNKNGTQHLSGSSSKSPSNIKLRNAKDFPKPFQDSVKKEDAQFEKRRDPRNTRKNRNNENTKSQQMDIGTKMQDKQFRGQDSPHGSSNVLTRTQKYQDREHQSVTYNKNWDSTEQYSTPDNRNSSVYWDNSGQYLTPDSENLNTEDWDSSGQYLTPDSKNLNMENYDNTGQYATPNNENLNNTGQYSIPDNTNLTSESWDSECFGSQLEENLSTVNLIETSDNSGHEWSASGQNKDDYFENNYHQTNKQANIAKNQNWTSDSRKSYPMDSHYEKTSKRYSEGSNFGHRGDWSKDGSKDNRGSSKDWRNRNLNERRSESSDKEYRTFIDEERRKGKVEFIRVEEIVKDLFEMPKEYSLAHCVAEDMRMGSGIAVTFKREFKQIDHLLNQRPKQGGLGVLEDGNDGSTRYIYYLVTKRESTGKPTYEKFWSSLQKMRNHIREHNVKKLAIPRLGCGLDRLEWVRVKHMIEFLFRDVDVKITVCNFQQTEDSPEKPVHYTCKVVNVKKPVANIEPETTIIYLSSEDGYVSDEMTQLDKKFPFLSQFRSERKSLGNIIRSDFSNKSYLIYGCIIKKTKEDPFDFVSFAKCLSQINKHNKKDKYYYIGFQAIKDEKDDLLMEKIVTLLRNYLSNVDIYICWHGDLVSQMPVSYRDQ